LGRRGVAEWSVAVRMDHLDYTRRWFKIEYFLDYSNNPKKIMEIPTEVWTLIMDNLEDARPLYLASSRLLRAAPAEDRRYWENGRRAVDHVPKMPVGVLTIVDFAGRGNLRMVTHLLGDCDRTELDMAARAACTMGCLEVVRALHARGADLAGGGRNCAIVGASANGHLETVEYLCSYMPMIAAEGELALWLAATHGHYEVVACLYKKGVGLDGLKEHCSGWVRLTVYPETVRHLRRAGVYIET
jgi:hypothetical protein